MELLLRKKLLLNRYHHLNTHTLNNFGNFFHLLCCCFKNRLHALFLFYLLKWYVKIYVWYSFWSKVSFSFFSFFSIFCFLFFVFLCINYFYFFCANFFGVWQVCNLENRNNVRALGFNDAKLLLPWHYSLT